MSGPAEPAVCSAILPALVPLILDATRLLNGPSLLDGSWLLDAPRSRRSEDGASRDWACGDSAR